MLRWNDRSDADADSGGAHQSGVKAQVALPPQPLHSRPVPIGEPRADDASAGADEALDEPHFDAPFATLRSYPPPGAEGLSETDIEVVFQPIVSVTTRRVFAYEALTRCRWPTLTNPEVLFHQASRASCCGRLGRIVRAAAMERAGAVPLFVNIHPDELSERWLVRPDDPVFFHEHDVYLEITESAAFTHYETCVNVLREVRSRTGIFLAVDDLGAGHSNLKRVLDLEPRIVKLDRALITGLDQSARQQILVRHVVRLCMELGAEVVAEGIETADELSAVIDSGAHYAQGYLLARPNYPLPPAKWPDSDVDPEGRDGPEPHF